MMISNEANASLSAVLRPPSCVCALVHSKMCLSSEALVTLCALEGSFSGMQTLVSLLAEAGCESFLAHRTLVRFFSCVSALVHPQVRLMDEALATDGALVGPLSRVNAPPVGPEGHLLGEALATFLTCKRLLPCVGALVALEVVLHGEGLPAVHALIGLLARVNAQVSLQVHLSPEALAALGALKGLLARVNAHVGSEALGDGESFPAFRALEGLLACVYVLVLLERGLCGEALAALRVRAAVRPLSRVCSQVNFESVGCGVALVALRALVRPRPHGVNAAVRVEVALPTEAFATLGAGIRPLSCVNTLVPYHVRLEAERFVTHGTRESFRFLQTCLRHRAGGR